MTTTPYPNITHPLYFVPWLHYWRRGTRAQPLFRRRELINFDNVENNLGPLSTSAVWPRMTTLQESGQNRCF